MTMTTWKDHKKQDTLTWADVHFNCINKLFDARRCDEWRKVFTANVAALEIIMTGFFDDIYENDMKLMEAKLTEMREGSNITKSIPELQNDIKAQILCSLVHRVNVGRQKVREFMKNSEIVKEIGRKLLEGFGQNMIMTGAPGSGKSWASISLAEEVVKITGAKFSIKNIAFSVDDFTRIYNDINLTPKGSVVIFDEIGVSFNSRDAMGKANKLFGKLLQIIRHRQILVIFTTPDLSFIDSQGRKLLHWWLEIQGIDKRSRITQVKPHVIQINQQTGEIYYVFPMFNGNQYNDLRINAPTKRISEVYEEHAKNYKDEIAISTELDLKTIEVDKFKHPQYLMFKDNLEQGYISQDMRNGKVPGFTISPYMIAKYNKMLMYEKKMKKDLEDRRRSTSS